MPLTARTSPRYLWWLGLITVFCLGFGLWFLYDGTITYPRQRERALAYQELYQELKEQDRLQDHLSHEWKEIATERGWSPEYPEGEPKTEAEIYSQLVLAGVVGLPGLLCLVFLVRAPRRWIELDETGLRTSWGQQLEFDQIVTLDKKKWKNKGIAKITYDDGGRKRRLVLDDWKYDDEVTRAMLREVELRIDLDQIVGGLPEPPEEEPELPDEEPDLTDEEEEQGQVDPDADETA